MLYTDVVGPSTRTRKGREFVLQRDGAKAWLPLRAGQTFSARVREVRETGDSPLSSETLVLSLSPEQAARIPRISPGAILRISTDTFPQLCGVQSAISGGPTLVRQGKPFPINGSQARHPRSAIGWNDSSFFLVVVDGRQPSLSVGMSLGELATYMINLGCDEAMNLDGGGSSTMWVYGQVINSPCQGHERPMANALVLSRKEKTPSAAQEVNGALSLHP